jgi:hypothetical protein
VGKRFCPTLTLSHKHLNMLGRYHLQFQKSSEGRVEGTREIRVILYASAPGDCAKSKR